MDYAFCLPELLDNQFGFMPKMGCQAGRTKTLPTGDLLEKRRPSGVCTNLNLLLYSLYEPERKSVMETSTNDDRSLTHEVFGLPVRWPSEAAKPPMREPESFSMLWPSSSSFVFRWFLYGFMIYVLICFYVPNLCKAQSFLGNQELSVGQPKSDWGSGCQTILAAGCSRKPSMLVAVEFSLRVSAMLLYLMDSPHSSFQAADRPDRLVSISAPTGCVLPRPSTSYKAEFTDPHKNRLQNWLPPQLQLNICQAACLCWCGIAVHHKCVKADVRCQSDVNSSCFCSTGDLPLREHWDPAHPPLRPGEKHVWSHLHGRTSNLA